MEIETEEHQDEIQVASEVVSQIDSKPDEDNNSKVDSSCRDIYRKVQSCLRKLDCIVRQVP